MFDTATLPPRPLPAPRATRGAPRRYAIRELLHAGQNATIYRADLLAAGRFARPVALKVLNTTQDEVSVARLRDEARILGALRHRAIVGAHGLIEVEGRPAIVLEAVGGADLASLLARGPVPTSAALEIVEELAGALDTAWRARRADGAPLQLTHRAIEPRSVRVTAEGGVKLLGFDFARADLERRDAPTRTVGRQAALAPEQIRGESGPETDVYALGCLLYHMLYGRPLPRLGARRDVAAGQLAATLDLLYTQEPTRSGLLALLSAMLSFELEGRPSAREVARRVSALRRDADGQTLTVWAAGAVPTATRSPSTAAKDPLVGRVFEEGAGRRREGQAPRRPLAPTARASAPLTWILPGAALAAFLAALSVIGLGAVLLLGPPLYGLVVRAVGGG